MTIENGYTGPATTPVMSATKWKLMECNVKAMYVVLGGMIG